MRRATAGKDSTMVSLRLPRALLAALSRRAEQTGQTFSETVRELLAAGLKDWTSVEGEVRALRADVAALRRDVAVGPRRRTR